jgi:hypothetical protein
VTGRWFSPDNPVSSTNKTDQRDIAENKYLIQHSLKLGGTNYHFKWVKVPGNAPYKKPD